MWSSSLCSLATANGGRTLWLQKIAHTMKQVYCALSCESERAFGCLICSFVSLLLGLLLHLFITAPFFSLSHLYKIKQMYNLSYSWEFIVAYWKMCSPTVCLVWSYCCCYSIADVEVRVHSARQIYFISKSRGFAKLYAAYGLLTSLEHTYFNQQTY